MMIKSFNDNIFSDLSSLIDKNIAKKLKKDNNNKELFMNNLCREINKNNHKNPYSLDKYSLPIRYNDKNKQTAMGWYINEKNEFININVDDKLIKLNIPNIYENTLERIYSKYPLVKNKRSAFFKIISLNEKA